MEISLAESHTDSYFRTQWRNGYPQKGKRKVQGVPQLQTAALPRPQEEEETKQNDVSNTHIQRRTITKINHDNNNNNNNNRLYL